MNQVILNILDLLEQQKSLQESLLSLSHEKRQVIVKGDTDRLGEIVHEELRSLSKMSALEKKRVAALFELEGILGIPAKKITLSLLIEKAREGEKGRLAALQKELGSVMKAHRQLNKINQELIKTHLDYADTVLNEIVGAEDPLNNFYGGDGKTEAEKKRQSAGLFDQQI